MGTTTPEVEVRISSFHLDGVTCLYYAAAGDSPIIDTTREPNLVAKGEKEGENIGATEVVEYLLTYIEMAQIVMLVVALLLLQTALVASTAVPRLRTSVIAASKSSSRTMASADVNKWAVAAEEINPAPGVLGRLPSLPVIVAAGTLLSFLQTFAVMLPVGMVINGKVLVKEGFKPWMVKGSALGLDWGKVSALFVGGEKFVLELRGKEDRWNQILGSGLASALLRVDDGPAAMLQGAMLGCAFIMVIDLLQPTELGADSAIHAQSSGRKQAATTAAKRRAARTSTAIEEEAETFVKRAL